jgi:hypothetical protein
MLKRLLLCGAVVSLCLSLAQVARAQQSETTAFTFVASWTVPREKWSEFEANADKNVRPVFERLLAAGAILEWGIASRVVHTEDGPTHSAWWVSTSIAGLEKAREELIQTPNPAAAGAKHSDELLQSLAYHSRPSSVATGYLSASMVKVNPGMEREWLALWKKHMQPVLDGLLKNGTLLGFGVDVEYIHTQDPGWRTMWYLTPSAEAEDKLRAALDEVFEREAATLRAALQATSSRSDHRDSFWRVRSYAHR